MARGSIRKLTRAKGAVYEVRVDLGEAGTAEKRRQRSRTFRTRKEAQAALAAWLGEIDQGTAVGRTARTVGAVLTDWLEMEARPTVRPTTYALYAQVIRTHIQPALGAIPVQKLTAERVQRFYADLLAGGASAHLVARCHMRLRQALRMAVRLGIVTRDVTEATRPPRYRAPEMRVWTVEEAARVMDAARSLGRYGPIWTLSLTTGLRRGELLGLRWFDVDLDAGALRVRQIVTRHKGAAGDGPHRSHVGAPKTPSARRTVALPAFVVAELRAHHAAQLARRLELGPLWEDHGLVFPAVRGGPLHTVSLSREYDKVVRVAGVPRIRIHDHRHTHASIVLAGGGSVKALAERLGHTDAGLTLRTYTHSATAQHDAIAAGMDTLFAPIPAQESVDTPSSHRAGRETP